MEPRECDSLQFFGPEIKGSENGSILQQSQYMERMKETTNIFQFHHLEINSTKWAFAHSYGQDISNAVALLRRVTNNHCRSNQILCQNAAIRILCFLKRTKELRLKFSELNTGSLNPKHIGMNRLQQTMIRPYKLNAVVLLRICVLYVSQLHGDLRRPEE